MTTNSGAKYCAAVIGSIHSLFKLFNPAYQSCDAGPGVVQPYFCASFIAVPKRAAWCISFLGMHPTFTHVPPKPHLVPGDMTCVQVILRNEIIYDRQTRSRPIYFLRKPLADGST